ncbi:MAG: ATP-binding protein [Pseudomonadota bacterium]
MPGMKTDYEKLGAFYLGRIFDSAHNKLADEPLLYDSRDLTTHAVCVGMTGSGKTGLCLALLEEAAIDGIPAICIDPKGDIGNLLLTFPQLLPQDFAPWVDGGEAARRNLGIEQYAAQVAQQWQAGLAEWDQDPSRIAKFRDSVDLAIYTPGADNGLSLSVLQSFAPPADASGDSDGLAERISSIVSGLLTLLGRDADPLKSREHILLSNLLDHSWSAGRAMDLGSMVAAVQRPPIQKLGALDLETFFPARDRMELALAINSLLASPRFATWTKGEPLDAQRLLFTPEGKPRIAIISIAHLSDPERMFVVTLLLNEVVNWMRRQPGTSSLRAILYMDEIFGFFPPTATPPSKQPMLTLLKQARAYGVGCVLATQNPVDLDYKGLGNTGTWLIGRLQTERDRDRLLDGLTTALAGGGPDRGELAKQLGSLTQRVFLMRNVHDETPVLLKSRWALSYLRGPLTPAEIGRLMAPRKAAATSTRNGAANAAPPEAAAAATVVATASRPALPAEIEEAFVPVRGSREHITYQPRAFAVAKLHFVDKSLDLDEWQQLGLVAPLSDDGDEALWDESEPGDVPSLARDAVANSAYADLPAGALRAASYTRWGKDLSAYLYEHQRLTLNQCDELKLRSKPNESEGDFRSRIALTLREKRDARTEELRSQYGTRLAALQARLQKAAERTERERGQLTQQKFQAAISVGATVLGALLGRKAISSTNIGRATTAVRSASRIGRESGDVQRAEDSAAQLNEQIDALNKECESAVAELETTLDPKTVALRTVSAVPRKADIAVGKVLLLWTPSRPGADGMPANAS